ncbi:unnamed protein product [Malus baccata var. baccata]
MDLQLSSLAPIVTVTILGFSLFLYTLWLNSGVVVRRAPPTALAPAAAGAWPIIAHLHLLAFSSEPPHLVLGKLADKYGPIFTIKFGVKRTLVVSSSEMVKECLKTKDKIFANRVKCLGSEIIGYDYAFFAFTSYGHYFHQVRKIVMLELLSGHRIEMLKHIRESEVNASIKEIYERWTENNKSSGSNAVVVEMEEWFGDISENVIFRMIIGKRFSESTKCVKNSEGNLIGRKIWKDCLRLLGTFVVSDAIPLLRWLDLGGHEKAMKKMAKEIDDMLQGWVEEHKQKRKIGGGVKDDEERDFMDAMLSSILDGDDEVTQAYDADTITKATTLAILLAGVDVTTGTLTWALSLLLNNPKTLKKGPLALPHESSQDCTVGGYHIAARTRLLVNIWKLQRDPKVWSDPNEFHPERFLTTQKSIDVKGRDFELIPFGSGRRMCTGMSLALKLMPLSLASLLHGFEVSTPKDEPVDMGETLELTNHKSAVLEVLLSPRLPAQLY